MYSKNTIIKNKTGLHARPASDFANCASTFESDITIMRTAEPDEEVVAKSIVMLLTLGASQGEDVTITADGEDEVLAVDTLIELINSGFGE